MIDNTYNRFMIRYAEGMSRKIVDSDDNCVDDENHCLDGSMVLQDVEFLYISHPLRRGGRRGMVKRLNTSFNVSARYSGRRRRMCVHIVRT